ncbi:MAG: hypothetical protein NVS3B5_05710 [Sphingomicrobium sp.]
MLSYDASRLARNNGDWHQLLQLCSMFSVLIADSERLYDPGLYHDRLLLGLSGIMSEAELHQIRQRLYQGERQKAARGELRMPLPAGLAHAPGGGTMLNPDAEVQARIRLVFENFARLGSARGVVRTLRNADLALPVRPVRGPAPHEVVWREANDARVCAILKNPSYAGAYVYGRRCPAPERCRPGSMHPTKTLPREEWEVCIKNAHPAYISWEDYMSICDQLADNLGSFRSKHRGAPGRGRALLQGIVLCGRCGRQMALRYSGPQSDHPVYRCQVDPSLSVGQLCQEVRAPRIEETVERLFLAALTPDQLAITLAALDEIDGDTHALERQWVLKRERAAYEAERARRQYHAVEPENRLVARSLESLWEDKLREAERVEQDYQRWQVEQTSVLSAEDRARIATMGINLPGLWETIGNAERKAMLRLVIDKVILDQHRAKGMVWVRVLWQTGAATEHWVTRNTQSYADSAHAEQLEQQIRELNAAGRTDVEIAEALNIRGLSNTRGGAFNHGSIHLLRRRWTIPTVRINGVGNNPSRWPDGSYSVQGVADVLGTTTQTVFKWVRTGRIHGRQLTKGLPWQIDLSDEQIRILQRQMRRINSSRTTAS